MAGGIKGITIQIGGDTTGLNKALSDVNKKTNSLQSELKKVDKALKLDPKNTQLVAQKQELLGEAIATTKTKLDALRQAQEKVNKAHEANTEWEKQYASLRQEIEETEKKMKTLANKEKEMREQLESGKISEEKYTEYKNALKEVEEEHKTLKQSERDLEAQFENGHISDKEYREYQRTVVETESKLKSLQNELAETSNAFLGLSNKLDKAGNIVSDIGTKTSSIGTVITASVTAPIIAGSTMAVGAMDEVDEGLDTVMTKTGATGQAAKDLQAVYNDVARTIPADFGDIGAAVGEINTRLDFTGDKLRTASEDFLKFAKVNGTDVNQSVQLVTRAMGDAGIPADEYRTLLDALTVAGQKSGISIDTLTTNLAKYGAPMRALGIDTQTSIAMFAGWEKAGVNTEIAFSGMKKAISTWGAEGKDARVEFQKTLDEIKSAPDIASATSMAIEVFGQKAGPDLADAIQNGRFEFDEYITALEQSAGTVESTYGMIVDEVDDTQLAMQTVKVAAHDFGEEIAKTAGPEAKKLADKVKSLGDRFSKLTTQQKQSTLKTVAFVAAVGPGVKMVGSLEKGLGSAMKTGSKFIKTVGKVSAATSNLTGATKAAHTAQGLLSAAWKANPAGVVIAGVALLATGLYALHKALEDANKEEKEFAESQEHLSETLADGVEAAAEWKDGIDSAKGILDGCNESIMASSEKQAELSSRMESIQNEITSIARTATEERRSLTQQEIDRLNELFEQMKQVADQQLELEMSKQQAVKDVIQSTVDTWDGTADEYAAKAQDMIKSAQDTRDGVISALESQLVNETMLINQRTDLSAEAKEQMIRDATEAKNQKVALAEQEYADTYAIITNGQNQVMAQNDSFYNSYLTTLNRMTDAERNYNNDVEALKNYYIDMVRQGKMTEYQAIDDYNIKLKNLSQEHNDNMRGIWADYSNGLTDEQAKEAAILVQMAAETEASGGKIDESTRAMINAILSSYSMLDEEGQKKLSDAFSAMDMEITSGGELVYSSGEKSGQKVIDGFDSANIPEFLKQIAGDSADAYKNGTDERTEQYYQSGVTGIQAAVDGGNSVDTATPAAKKVDEAVAAMDKTFSDAQLDFLGSSYGNKVPTGFAAGIGGAIGLVTAQVGTIDDKVNTLSSFDSYTWGSHLAQGFANGISDNVKLIGNAALAGAEAAKSVLHFTRPDKGPLRDYEEWPVHFVSRYAELMKSQKPKLSNAALSLADSISAAMDADTAAKYQAMIDDIQHPKLVFPAPETSSPTPAQQSVDNQSMQISGTLHATIVMPDGRVLAEATAPYNNIELNKMLEAGRRYR